MPRPRLDNNEGYSITSATPPQQIKQSYSRGREWKSLRCPRKLSVDFQGIPETTEESLFQRLLRKGYKPLECRELYSQSLE